MAPGNTTSGQVLEHMILPALKKGGYTCETQIHIGKRIGGRRHFVDAIAEKNGRRILISLKWQQVAGTAEQKVPFELISLVQSIIDSAGAYAKAYLVLGGEGWTLRDFYTNGGLKAHLDYADNVDIVTLENFIGLANQGRL